MSSTGWRPSWPTRWMRTTSSSSPNRLCRSKPEAPWNIVEGNEKKRARLNCIDQLLQQIPYEDVPHEDVNLPDRVFNPEYERQVLPSELYVPQKY